MTELPHPRIDAHLHLWNRARSSYDWITPELGALDDDFDPVSAFAALTECGIDSAILIQADDTVHDTDYMLEIASANRWVAGVVGWIPLEHPARAEVLLERWVRHPVFRGVRQLVHTDPRDVLGNPAVLDTLGIVASEGLAFDVPDAWPRLMPSIPAIADAVPALTVVIDHLAKPPKDPEQFAEWAQALSDVAARSNTITKLSGLQGLTAAGRDRAWHTALDTFGPSRIAYGGDWPITVPHGGYPQFWEAMSELIAQLSAAEQGELLAGTATRAYRLQS